MAEIDEGAVSRFMADLQKEFDKNGPIRVPVEADGSMEHEAGRSTTIYNGPVIMGSADGAQLAWGNQSVTQTQGARTAEIAPGFEKIAEAVTETLRRLPMAGLRAGEQEDAIASATEVLREVTKPEPDRGLIRRALAALKGFLAPVATGLAAGAGSGAQEWAKTAIEHLGQPF